MTVIAYDGLYVAADCMLTNESGMIGASRKIEVFEKQVLATCGAADHGEAMLIWFKDGKDPKAFPHQSDGGDKNAYLYVFALHMPVLCFQTWPAPVIITMDKLAAGAGGEIARTAMHLGRDAREACRIATELNVFCGGGIEYVALAELENNGDAKVRRYAQP